MQFTKINETIIDIVQTIKDNKNCEPNTNTEMLQRDAPKALRIKSSCVRCSKDDNPILICPNTENK